MQPDMHQLDRGHLLDLGILPIELEIARQRLPVAILLEFWVDVWGNVHLESLDVAESVDGYLQVLVDRIGQTDHVVISVLQSHKLTLIPVNALLDFPR